MNQKLPISLRCVPVAFVLSAALGCAAEKWNLDRYRDERAIDIENRLNRDEPVVKNPFGRAEPD